MSADYEQKQKQFFAKLLSDPSNNLCADCGSKSPRWASWNLGSFICIRCSGIHRKLGVHITKVKSVTLDKWTDEQLDSMKNGGNAKVNAMYNPGNVALDPAALASGSDADRRLEQYIRDKYEYKRLMNGAVPNYHQSSTPTQRSSSSSFAYQSELRQLISMGFDEGLAREGLQQTRGNVPSAVEFIVQSRKPSISTTAQPSISANTPREYFKDAPRMLNKEVNSSGVVLHQGTSPLLKQLHNMGFTNDDLNMAAINQANGSLELAVEMLAENKVSATQTTQIQQKQTQPKKQDLLGLFDSPPKQDNNDFGDFQSTATPNPSTISSNAQKKLDANDILGLFDTPVQQPAQQQPQQQSFNSFQQPQQTFNSFQQSAPPTQQPQQQFNNFQQSPPSQQFTSFQQSPPSQQFTNFQQPQPTQQFNNFQQSPPQQQFNTMPTQYQQRANSPPTSNVSNPFSNNSQQFQSNPFTSPNQSQTSSNYTVQVFFSNLAASTTIIWW